MHCASEQVLRFHITPRLTKFRNLIDLSTLHLLGKGAFIDFFLNQKRSGTVQNQFIGAQSGLLWAFLCVEPHIIGLKCPKLNDGSISRKMQEARLSPVSTA